MTFLPTRTHALERLASFVPKAGADYARLRNFDFGPGAHRHVSTLSPYLRTRLLTEEEVLRAVLGRHSAQAAEKFVQEVFWRTYWKGWLEMRPSVWASYRAHLAHLQNRLATESGLRQHWESACLGQTGIDAFDAWARELTETGYMHNHARMWFASIWIFTLGLPWELGADFFLRHLLDADAASNTLSWRWVAGLHTQGKTYLATAENIARYTEGRHRPEGLAPFADPLTEPPNPPRSALPLGDTAPEAQQIGLILHDEDLAPDFLFSGYGMRPEATLLITTRKGLSPFHVAPKPLEFSEAVLADTAARWAARLGPVTGPASTPDALVSWARDMGLTTLVTPYAPVGPTADLFASAKPKLAAHGIRLAQIQRPFDARAWPHATHGFFRFKEAIPKLLKAL